MSEERKRKKASIDFDKDVEILLDRRKRGYPGLSYSSMINDLVRTMYNLTPQVKKALSLTIESLYDELLHSTPNEGSFGASEKDRSLTQLDKLYMLLNNNVSLEKSSDLEINMQTIHLSNGYAIVPENWIQIEWEANEQSEYIGIVETHNGAAYKTPYFFFTTSREPDTFEEYEKEAIYKRCCKVYPLFKDILEMQVSRIYKDGRIINFEESENAPLPGIISLAEDGTQDTYPFGARIFRRNTK